MAITRPDPTTSAPGVAPRRVTDRSPYEPPRLVHLGSFRDLTRGGGLTGADQYAPEGQRSGH